MKVFRSALLSDHQRVTMSHSTVHWLIHAVVKTTSHASAVSSRDDAAHGAKQHFLEPQPVPSGRHFEGERAGRPFQWWIQLWTDRAAAPSLQSSIDQNSGLVVAARSSPLPQTRGQVFI